MFTVDVKQQHNNNNMDPASFSCQNNLGLVVLSTVSLTLRLVEDLLSLTLLRKSIRLIFSTKNCEDLFLIIFHKKKMAVLLCTICLKISLLVNY